MLCDGVTGYGGYPSALAHGKEELSQCYRKITGTLGAVNATTGVGDDGSEYQANPPPNKRRKLTEGSHSGLADGTGMGEASVPNASSNSSVCRNVHTRGMPTPPPSEEQFSDPANGPRDEDAYSIAPDGTGQHLQSIRTAARREDLNQDSVRVCGTFSQEGNAFQEEVQWEREEANLGPVLFSLPEDDFQQWVRREFEVTTISIDFQQWAGRQFHISTSEMSH